MNQAVVTPSASSGGSDVANPLGSVRSRVAVSRSATPPGFSTVVMFHEKLIRSRQKLSVANMPEARATSRAKPASHASTRCCGAVRVPGSRVWVMVVSFAYAV